MTIGRVAHLFVACYLLGVAYSYSDYYNNYLSKVQNEESDPHEVSPPDWNTRDAIEDIRFKMNRVTAENCDTEPSYNLHLTPDTVSHLPDIKEININPIFPNRTVLLHLHNMALTRSFFWSYILQSRNYKPPINDTYDPGMMYYLLGSLADVAANPYINASAIYFAPHMAFSSSYRGFFNKTLFRFGPRTFRADDFNDPVHLERISTRNTFYTQDLGAFPSSQASKDYTSELYKINEW